MKHPEDEITAVYLQPGEMFSSDKPALVTTILGSCVSVTFFSPRLGVGAMSHAMLPKCKKQEPCSGHCAEGLRYVECSISRMLEKFAEMGIGRAEIEVKVFGGSDMLKTDAKETVGAQNIRTAFAAIKGRNLRLKVSDTGGMQGRKIMFFSRTGEVLVKKIRTTEPW